MSEFKRWDEFFDKKNNMIKENVNISVNPNQFTIVYDDSDDDDYNFKLVINTPNGKFYTKLNRFDDLDLENLDEEQ